jgi:hypothetical protein
MKTGVDVLTYSKGFQLAHLHLMGISNRQTAPFCPLDDEVMSFGIKRVSLRWESIYEKQWEARSRDISPRLGDSLLLEAALFIARVKESDPVFSGCDDRAQSGPGSGSGCPGYL